MQTLGMRLRQEREKKEIPLQTIAAQTKIKASYLEAIEADDLAAFPGEYFYRAFVRQYASFLGLDAAAIENQLNTVSSRATVEFGGVVAAPTDDSQMHALRETLKEKPMRLSQDDGTSKRWMAFAALVIAGCAIYYTWPQWMPNTRANNAPVPQVASNTPTPPIEAKAPAPEPAEAPKQNSSVQITPVSTPTQAPTSGQFSLELVARQMTWTRILADGTRVHYGPLEAGQRKTINASTAEVLIGNAGTMDVIYNGKPLQYGEMGQVKTLLFSPDGWKFKPKPVSQEADSASSTAESGAGSF
ncbi:MAG: DUF4115 domain-containing protein [Bryobacter sp.]|nr:DUF4115 domain-containing protein [Bryobacter sp.]